MWTPSSSDDAHARQKGCCMCLSSSFVLNFGETGMLGSPYMEKQVKGAKRKKRCGEHFGFYRPIHLTE